MSFRRSLSTVFAFALLMLPVASGWAMRSIGLDQPVDGSTRAWPAGSEKLANLPTRFRYETGGLTTTFENYVYAGDTAKFQEALDLFAAIDSPSLELCVFDAGRTGEIYWTEKPVDWQFSVTFNDTKATVVFATPEGRDLLQKAAAIPVPRLTLYLGEGSRINWADVRIPSKLTLIDRRVESSIYKDSKGGVLHVNVQTAGEKQPLAGAILTLSESDPKAPPATFNTTSDENGIALARDLPAGLFKLELTAPGYAAQAIGYYRNYGRTFETLAAKLAKAARLSGIVTDAAGNPIAGAKVTVKESLGLDGADAGAAIEAESNEAGRFILEPLPQGRASLNVRKVGYYFYSTDMHAVPSENVKVVMNGAGAVQGKILGPGGKPETREFIVEIAPKSGATLGSWGGSASTKAGAQFQFNDVPAGEYVITAHPNPGRENDISAPLAVTIEGGKTVNLDVPAATAAP